MKDKLKPTWYLILNRLWDREKCVLILFVIAIVIIMAYELITADCVLEFADNIHSFIETIISFLSKGKELLYALAISCVSGIFVYFLTVILPETRRSKPILVDVENSLKYLKDELHDVAEFVSLDDATEITIQYLKQHNKLDNEFYNMNCSGRVIEEIHKSLEMHTSHILSYSSALSQSEIETLIDIKHRRISRLIRYKYEENELLNKKQIEDDFKEFVQLNNDIIKLHESVKNRIYKQ